MEMVEFELWRGDSAIYSRVMVILRYTDTRTHTSDALYTHTHTYERRLAHKNCLLLVKAAATVPYLFGVT